MQSFDKPFEVFLVMQDLPAQWNVQKHKDKLGHLLYCAKCQMPTVRADPWMVRMLATGKRMFPIHFTSNHDAETLVPPPPKKRLRLRETLKPGQSLDLENI